MLSFNLPTATSVSSFTLAGMSGLSMGEDARDLDAGDPRRGTFATGGEGVDWTKRSTPMQRSPTSIKTGVPSGTGGIMQKPAKLSFFGLPNIMQGTASGATLSMPTSVPKTTSSNRFNIGGTLSSLVSGLSMGTPISQKPSPRVTAAYSTPRPSTMANLPTSIVPVQRNGDENVLPDLLTEAAATFTDFLQPAAAKVGAFGGGTSGGGGGTSRGVSGTDALIFGGGAVLLLALFWPRGSRSAPRRSSVPRRRKTARAKR